MTTIKVAILALNIFMGHYSANDSEKMNLSMAQYSINKAMCSVNKDEQSCISYCSDSEYFGHNMSEEMVGICSGFGFCEMGNCN